MYRELNLDKQTSTSVFDQSGKAKEKIIAVIPALKFGGVEFKKVSAIIFEDSSIIFKCLGIDGFIGSNLFQDCVLAISKV